MTPQEIKENNILLAEFLGWGKFETFEGSEEYVLTEVKNLNLKVGDFNIFGLKEMKFDTDWNWIMMVVDEIEIISHTQVNIFYNYTRVSHKGIDFEKRGYNKIEGTYSACVEFVKWYNRNVSEDNSN